MFAASEATLANTTGGNMVAYVDELNFTPSARIKGGLEYWRRGPAIEIPRDIVAGQTTYHAIEAPRDESEIQESLSTAGQFLWIVWLIGTLIASAIVMAFLPGAPSAALTELADRPVRAFAIGLGGIVGFPLAAILISFTLVGIPFVMLASGLWLLGIYVGWMILAAAIGALLVNLIRRGPAATPPTVASPSRFGGVPPPIDPIAIPDTPLQIEAPATAKRPAPHASLLTVAGMIVLSLATLIPALGGAISFVGICLGLGLAITLLWRLRGVQST